MKKMKLGLIALLFFFFSPFLFPYFVIFLVIDFFLFSDFLLFLFSLGADTITEGFGFADVEDALLLVPEKINAGKVGQMGEFFLCGSSGPATCFSMAGGLVHVITALNLLLFQVFYSQIRSLCRRG